MGHPSETASIVIILMVAILAVFLTVIATRGVLRTGNKRLWFVTGAFALLAVRGFLVAASLPNHMIAHGPLELITSLFDLGVVILLALPLLR